MLRLLTSGILIILRHPVFGVGANPDESDLTILPTSWERFMEQNFVPTRVTQQTEPMESRGCSNRKIFSHNRGG